MLLVVFAIGVVVGLFVSGKLSKEKVKIVTNTETVTEIVENEQTRDERDKYKADLCSYVWIYRRLYDNGMAYERNRGVIGEAGRLLKLTDKYLVNECR